MSEAGVSQAAIVTELVEYKQSVENSLSAFPNEVIEITKGILPKILLWLVRSKMPQAEKQFQARKVRR